MLLRVDAHLGIDPGSATGGFTLLSARALCRDVLPVLLWGYYRKAYSKQKGQPAEFRCFLLEVVDPEGEAARYECETLWHVYAQIRRSVMIRSTNWSLCVEGLFIGKDKSPKSMVDLAESAGLAKGCLYLGNGALPRPMATQWRSSCGIPTGKMRGERFAKRAVKVRFTNMQNCTVIHAVESAFIALYGRLSRETL